MHNKYKKQQGFTIIETMIVLAIAALIMLIVFLAVPALERSARNTQRKNDAGNILTAVDNYVSNNNGALPATTTILQGIISGGGVSLGYYKATDVFLDSGSTTTAVSPGTSSLPGIHKQTAPGIGAIGGTSGPNKVTANDVILIPGTTCNDNMPTTTNATNTSYTLVYAVETSTSGIQEQCIAS